jgi:hypothetical protein
MSERLVLSALIYCKKSTVENLMNANFTPLDTKGKLLNRSGPSCRLNLRININSGTEKSLIQQFSRILNRGFSLMIYYNRSSTKRTVSLQEITEI